MTGASALIAALKKRIGPIRANVREDFGDTTTVQRLDIGQPNLCQPILKIQHGTAAVQGERIRMLAL